MVEVVSETIKNEAKDQRIWFPSELLGTLDIILLEDLLSSDLLTGDGVIWAGSSSWLYKAIRVE